MHDDVASWTLISPYGGRDRGEVRQIASRVTPGVDASFVAAFRAMAERRIEQADDSAALGRTANVRDCYLRAAALLAVGQHPLYGASAGLADGCVPPRCRCVRRGLAV